MIYELSGNPVFIADLSHTMLAYTKCVEVTHESWQNNVVNAQHAAPIIVNVDNLPFPRIIKTLRAEGHTIGVMVLTAYFKPFGPEDTSQVEIISSFIVKHMQRERAYISAGGLTVENYLIKLLNGAKYPPPQIKKHLDILGWKSAPHLYLLTLWSQNEEESDVGLSEILDILSEQVHYRIDKCKELLKNDLEDSNEVFSIMLSLRIEYEKKFIG